jgi:hypothetical protein
MYFSIIVSASLIAYTGAFTSQAAFMGKVSRLSANR